MGTRSREAMGLNQPPQQMVRVMALGDTGYVLADLQLMPAVDAEGNLTFVLMGIGGSKAQLELGGAPKVAVLGELPIKLSMLEVARRFGKPELSAEPENSGLVVVP